MNIKVLVNKTHLLDKNYIPKDLIYVNEPCGKKLDKNYKVFICKKVYKAFKVLQRNAKKENMYLYIDSGYRSYEYQKDLYLNAIKEKGIYYANKYLALPGASEHQTGLAIDFIYMRNGIIIENIKECSKEMKWLKDNAYKYGFILRYPKGKENVTLFNYEFWHYRFVGKKLAKYLYRNNLTLDEYYLN